MRKIAALLALSTILFSCEADKGYFLSGNISDVADGTTIYVSEIDNNNRPEKIDSTTIKDGKFEIDLKDIEKSDMALLEIDGIGGNVLYIAENQKIAFEIYKDSLRASKIEGGKENKALKEYLDHLKAMNQKIGELRMEMRTAMQSQDTAKLNDLRALEAELIDNDKVFKKKMVSENTDSFVSLMVLTDLSRIKSLPNAEIKEMYDSLSEDLKENHLAKRLKENIDRVAATDVGAKAPGFSGPTPSGKELSLKDAMGKVTIIDFWAAWCKPCRIENPNVVKVYNKYHDKGLNIIGVSLDRAGQKDKWLQAIEDDGLTWNHISHLKFWQEPIAQAYDVKSIPATFILDENGIIVARDLRGQDLENKIKELLGE